MWSALAVSLCALGSVTCVPSRANSSHPAFIQLVGESQSGPDSSGTFTIFVRDGANNPIANSQVVLSLSDCADARLCPNSGLGQTIDCPTRTIRGFTDGLGSITFTLVGAGTNSGASPGSGLGCATITADGVPIDRPSVQIYDQDGALGMGGIGVTDLRAVLRDIGSGLYFARSDFDGNGTLNVADLALFIHRMGSGSSVSNCVASFCP